MLGSAVKGLVLGAVASQKSVLGAPSVTMMTTLSRKGRLSASTAARRVGHRETGECQWGRSFPTAPLPVPTAWYCSRHNARAISTGSSIAPGSCSAPNTPMGLIESPASHSRDPARTVPTVAHRALPMDRPGGRGGATGQRRLR